LGIDAAVVAVAVLESLQGDHLSEKPGNVRELYRRQRNVRNFAKSHGNVRELSGKNLVMENCPKTFIIASTGFLVSCVVEMRTEDCVTFIILHYSVAVDGTGFYDVIIMKSLSLNMNLTV